MFEKLKAYAERRARERSEMRAARIAARIARAAAPGIDVDAAAPGIGLSGRGLIRRHAAEPALRRSIREALR